MLNFAPTAQASWSSSFKDAQVDWESPRWSDELYSQVTMHDCWEHSSIYVKNSVDIQMWQDITSWPDDSFDNKTFTACFNQAVSNGEWSLPSGKKNYYFQIMKIGGSTSKLIYLDVGKYVVDSTKAD